MANSLIKLMLVLGNKKKVFIKPMEEQNVETVLVQPSVSEMIIALDAIIKTTAFKSDTVVVSPSLSQMTVQLQEIA